MSRHTRAIVRHELRLLRRNPVMWFRFVLFYLAFAGALVVDVIRGNDARLSLTATGLMVIAAVGIATALASESFVQEKERRTMEALLLIPTSSASIASAKATFIIGAALLGVVVAFITGPLAVAFAGTSAQYAHVLNRATCLTAALACPPATIAIGGLGTVVSSRSLSYQTAQTAAPILGMLLILPTITVAYLMTETPIWATVAITVIWWLLAIGTWRAGLAANRPETMIRTRGR